MKKLFIILSIFILSCNFIFAQESIFEKMNTGFTTSKSANEKIERFKSREAIKNWESVLLKSNIILSKNFKGVFNIFNKNIEFEITKDFGIDVNGVQGFKAELKNGGYAILSSSINGIGASIWYKDGFYSIEAVEDEIYFVSEVDIIEISKHESPNDYSSIKKLNKTTKNRSVSSVLSSATIKVFVAYTPAVAQNYNIATLLSECRNTTNNAFGNSGVESDIVLAGSAQLTYTESGDDETDIDRFQTQNDGYLEDIHSLRNQYEADVCVLLVNTLDANGISASIGAEFDDAFCVVKAAPAVSYYSFAHELGHFFGCRHEEDNSSNYPYDNAHGYYWEDGKVNNVVHDYCTIMSVFQEAYGGKYLRVQYFSNPYVYDQLNNPMGTTNYYYCANAIDGYASNIAAFEPHYTTSGTITVNEWWSGTITITDNLTVASGITLTIQSGSTIQFASGKSLTINGTLNATSSTFTSAYTWGGIQFNSGSSGNLNGCTINNVQTYYSGVVKINDSSPTIQNCTISNNGSSTWGLYIMNNAAPILTGNTISNNTLDQILFDHAGGYLTHNIITASNGNASINCWDHANPTFSTTGGSTGLNLIQNGAYGIIADEYSTPNAGTSSSQSSNNKLLNASALNAFATGYSTIHAQYNYWSPTPPSRIGADAGSDVDYDNYLANPPFSIENPDKQKEQMLLKNTVATSNDDDDLLTAINLKSKKKYNEAINIYKQILNKDENEYLSSTALVELDHIYFETKDKELFNYIKNFTKNTTIKGLAIDMVVKILLYESQLEEAKTLNDELLSDNFKKTRFAMKGKLNLFHYYYKQGNYSFAKDILSELKANEEWNIGINTAELLMNEIDQSAIGFEKQVKKVENDIIVTDFSLDQNYPNPFNPTTIISFSIPQKGNVKLRIFDVLGREIANLADGVYEVGKYELTFDASKLPSGIYFYNLVTASGSFTKKMILIK